MIAPWTRNRRPPPPSPARRSRRAASSSRRSPIGLALVVAGVVVAGVVADDPPGPVVERRDPLLPDLAMGPIEDIAVGTTEDGEQRLRFAASIVNIGEGPLLVRAQRPPVELGRAGASTSGSRSATAATPSARPAAR